MSTMSYIEARDGNLYVGSSHVTVESVIARWQSGRTPEEIQTGFPSLPLVAVYGTITYYLEHKDELDALFQETERLDEARRVADEAERPEFYASMRQRILAAAAARAEALYRSNPDLTDFEAFGEEALYGNAERPTK